MVLSSILNIPVPQLLSGITGVSDITPVNLGPQILYRKCPESEHSTNPVGNLWSHSIIKRGVKLFIHSETSMINYKLWPEIENDIDSFKTRWHKQCDRDRSPWWNEQLLSKWREVCAGDRRFQLSRHAGWCTIRHRKKVPGGTAIFHVDELLGETTVSENLFQVTNIILHIGTCNFDPARTNKVDTIYIESVECIHNVQIKYAGADIMILGVLPRAHRAGRKNDKLNGEIIELNRNLSLLEKEVSYIMYADHDLSFVENCIVRQNLNHQTDKTGMHINEKGSQALSEYLPNVIVE